MQAFLFNQFGISRERQNDVLWNEQYSITGIITQGLGSMTQLIGETVLVLAYVFLFLYYRNHLKRFYLRTPSASPPPGGSPGADEHHPGFAAIPGWFEQDDCLSLGPVRHRVYTDRGEEPRFLCIFCGFCEIIPFIGNITGTSLTMIVSLVQGAGLPMLLGILLIYGVIQFIQGWVLEPLILGRQVRINPLATVVALVIGGTLWGIAGIFLAIPLVAMFKVTCDHIESLKAIGFLIGMPPGRKALR